MTPNAERRSILLTALYCVTLLFLVAAGVYIMGYASDHRATKTAQHAAAAGVQNQ